MTPPTNAGTYSCTVKLPDSNVYYMSAPITVQLTIKKIATKTPKAAQAAAWTDTSVTLEAPSAFVDGTAIPAGYELEYCVDQGEWQDSPVFTGLTPETTYKFYVRLKEGVNTTASAASEAVTVQTKKASSDPSNPTKPNPSIDPRQSAGNDHFRPRQKYQHMGKREHRMALPPVKWYISVGKPGPGSGDRQAG